MKEIEGEAVVKKEEEDQKMMFEDEMNQFQKVTTAEKMLQFVDNLQTSDGRNVIRGNMVQATRDVGSFMKGLVVHYGPPYYEDYGGDIFEELTSAQVSFMEVHSCLNNGFIVCFYHHPYFHYNIFFCVINWIIMRWCV